MVTWHVVFVRMVVTVNVVCFKCKYEREKKRKKGKNIPGARLVTSRAPCCSCHVLVMALAVEMVVAKGHERCMSPIGCYVVTVVVVVKGVGGAGKWVGVA